LPQKAVVVLLRASAPRFINLGVQRFKSAACKCNKRWNFASATIRRKGIHTHRKRDPRTS